MYGDDTLNAYIESKVVGVVTKAPMLFFVRMKTVSLRDARSRTAVKSNVGAVQLTRKPNFVPAHAPDEH